MKRLFFSFLAILCALSLSVYAAPDTPLQRAAEQVGQPLHSAYQPIALPGVAEAAAPGTVTLVAEGDVVLGGKAGTVALFTDGQRDSLGNPRITRVAHYFFVENPAEKDCRLALDLYDSIVGELGQPANAAGSRSLSDLTAAGLAALPEDEKNEDSWLTANGRRVILSAAQHPAESSVNGRPSFVVTVTVDTH